MNDLYDFSIYDKDTGEVIRTGKVPDQAHAEMQVQDGEGVVMRKLDPSTHYVVGGRVKEYTEAEQARLLARPTMYHVWSIGRKEWEDRRSSEELRQYRRDLIKQQMDEAELGQDRAMREFALNGDRTRLQQIEDAVAPLRDQWNALR